MPRFPLPAAAVLLGALASTATGAGAVKPTEDRPFKGRVEIVALISSTHQVFAGNQQTYLAMLAGKDSNEPVLLVDQFRTAGDPIRRRWLRDHVKFTMRLTREDSCDRSTASVASMLDPLQVYDQESVERLEEHGPATLPCYRVDHDRTRVQR